MEGLVMRPDFWRGRRVLVTGHTGFKGCWLAKWLVRMGAVVTGYALEAEAYSNLYLLSGLEHDMSSVIGDVQDFGRLSAVINQARPEVVFHLAAQAQVREAYRHPVATYATNVMGTVHLLEAIRQHGQVKAVVNVTTDKCYENQEWFWPYRESDALGGADPYSSSKACSEMVTQAYRSSFFQQDAGTAMATARAGNVVGGGDASPERLVPGMMAAWEKGEILEIRMPHAVRPWQYVLEPLRGYMVLAEHLTAHGQQYASSWNFGPLAQEACSVEAVVKKMAEKLDSKCEWRVSQQDQPHEAHQLRLDCSKSAALLNWRPLMNWMDALDEVIAWHHHWKSGANMADFMNQRIDSYQARAVCAS